MVGIRVRGLCKRPLSWARAKAAATRCPCPWESARSPAAAASVAQGSKEAGSPASSGGTGRPQHSCPGDREGAMGLVSSEVWSASGGCQEPVAPGSCSLAGWGQAHSQGVFAVVCCEPDYHAMRQAGRGTGQGHGAMAAHESVVSPGLRCTVWGQWQGTCQPHVVRVPTECLVCSPSPGCPALSPAPATLLVARSPDRRAEAPWDCANSSE